MNDTSGAQYDAAASSEISEVAKTQELTADEQKIANTYDPQNSTRDIYLRTKYQMYMNKHLRNHLAIDIMDGIKSLHLT